MASRIVFDASTGQQSTVELTAEELLAFQSVSGDGEERTADDAVRTSARAKLAAIGLTEEEITALVG
jgi:hypothetical protein